MRQQTDIDVGIPMVTALVIVAKLAHNLVDSQNSGALDRLEAIRIVIARKVKRHLLLNPL